MDLATKLEAARRKRRTHGPWTREDEEAWLKDHPEDENTPHAPFQEEGATSDDVAPEPVAAGDSPATTTVIAGPDTSEYADAVPEVETPRDPDELDRALENLDIITAYEKFCGKMQVPRTRKTEGIKISCPDPAHPDNDPSAWINTNKQTYYCAPCDTGGDKFTIAALNLGYGLRYQESEFPRLKEQMCVELGYAITKSRRGKVTSVTSEPEQAPAKQEEQPEPEPEATDDDLPWEAPPASNVVPLRVVPQETPTVEDFPEMEYNSLLEPNTFLADWMHATADNDPERPPEYYFWLGLMALGLALGESTHLADQPPVRGNLYVCLYGKTGAGKSRAMKPFIELLESALPYDHDDPSNKGARIISGIGSAEALIDCFSKPIIDPSTFRPTGEHAPVRGLVEFHEFSDLAALSNRHGNVMKPKLMQLYDAYGDVHHITRGQGKVIAKSPFASVITTTQPKAVRGIVQRDDIGSGFLNRWIFVMGSSSGRRNFINRTVFDLSSSILKLKAIRSWAGQHSEVTLSQEAEDLLNEFLQDKLSPYLEDEDNELGIRIELTCKKLALLFAANARSNVVTADHARKVISMWPYLYRSYALLQGRIGLEEIDECVEAIRIRIERFRKKHDEWPTMQQIRDGVRRQFSSTTIARTVNIMLDLELIWQQTVKKKSIYITNIKEN